MVVIIIVGIVAALAVPTMAQARLDRDAFEDAGEVMELFRSARTLAVGRNAAILIQATADGVTNRGRFQMYEAVTPNAQGGDARTGVSTCKSPMNWSPLDNTNAKVLHIDGVDLNGHIESDANLQTLINTVDNTGKVVSVKSVFICFTPLGRSYVSASSTVPSFDGSLPSVAPLEFRVQRLQGANVIGTVRSVILPPNGMARVFSHVSS
jgi:type II secretory pathway pseudopilin PulG